MAEYPGKEIQPISATGPMRTHGGSSAQLVQSLQYITNWYLEETDKNQYDSHTYSAESSYGPTIVRGGGSTIIYRTLDYVSNWFYDESDKNLYVGRYYSPWMKSLGPAILRGGINEIKINVLYAPERTYGGLETVKVLKLVGPFRPDKIYDTNILHNSTIKTGGLVPTEPTNVVFATNKYGFRIDWGTPESDIDGRPVLDYGVFMSEDGYKFTQTDNVSVNRFVYGDVFPAHTKYISIRACNFNGYGNKSTIFELNPGFNYNSQISFARKTSEDDMPHGLYSSHNKTDNNGNSIFFALWTPQHDADEDGNKRIIDFNAETGVNMIHILPIENSKYSIGSDSKPFTTTTGSEIYTDTIKTKTFRLHSGK